NLYAGNIFLVAQAEDRDIASQVGVSTTSFLQQGLIGPVADIMKNLVSMPIKVLVKKAAAAITIGNSARLLSNEVIGVSATAATDSSGQANSERLSIGYAQAGAKATIDIQSYALVQGNGPINITSTANAAARMATATEREDMGSVPGLSIKGYDLKKD